MANLPSQHPSLSLHLTDITLTPLITSSSSESHLESLTSLTTSAITSHTAAQRANLGKPRRIMVEYPDAGPVVLHSYIDPCESGSVARSESDPGTVTTAASSSINGDEAAPALVGIVVAATSDQGREARRAVSRLETVGREFQREWNVQDTHSTA